MLDPDPDFNESRSKTLVVSDPRNQGSGQAGRGQFHPALSELLWCIFMPSYPHAEHARGAVLVKNSTFVWSDKVAIVLDL